jgi:hypothetical protein
MVAKEGSHCRTGRETARSKVEQASRDGVWSDQTRPKLGSRDLNHYQGMTPLNTTNLPSSARPSAATPIATVEAPSGFATLTNGVSLDPDDEDQDDSMEWEEVDILGTEVPEVQPITEVEVTIGENQRVRTSRK